MIDDKINMGAMRYIQVFMAFLAVTLSYIQRVNISLAAVVMANNTNSNSDFPSFGWDQTEMSRIYSSFFWGYPSLQIVAGNMSEKYGVKIVLGLAMAFSSLFTVTLPFLAGYGYFVVCILRVIQGAAQGSVFPCSMVLVSKWVPLTEQGRALSIIYSGANLGPPVGYVLSGYLAYSRGGWPSIFYVTGALAFLWVLFWIFVGANSPSEHTFISQHEREMIENALRNENKENKAPPPTPWKEILTSRPMWAIQISHLGQNWGFWTLVTQLPNYLNGVLGVNVQTNGVLNSLPYLTAWGTSILFSWISEYVKNRNYFSTIVLKQFWNSVGLWGCAFFLLLLGIYSSNNLTVIICLLIGAVALDSGIYSGFLINHIDLSPNYCGTLIGITNSVSNITSILGPLCVGWIVTNPSATLQWSEVFVLSAFVMFMSNLFYLFFSSTELQSWNDPKPKTATPDDSG